MNLKFGNKAVIAAAVSTLLFGCATQSGEVFKKAQSEYHLQATDQLSPRQKADLYEAILAGDLAAQQQDHQSAMSYYLFAADLSKQKVFVEKSIDAALAIEDPLGLEQAANIWLSIEPQSQEALVLLMRAQIEQQNIAAGVETATQLFNIVTESESRFAILNAEILDLEPREAFNFIRSLDKAFPNEVAVMTAQAKFIMSLSSSNKRPKNILNQALNRISQALEIRADFLPAIRVKTQILFQLRQDDKARYYLTELFDQNPTWAEISHLLGQLLYDLRDFSAAQAHFTDWLNKHPNDERARYLLAASAYAQNDFETAFQLFSKLATGNHESDTAAFYCGDSALKLNLSDAALECFLNVQQGRLMVPAKIQAAHIYAENQQVDAALSVLRTAQELSDNEAIQLVSAEVDILNQYKSRDAAKQKLQAALQQSPDNLALILKKIEIYQLTSKPDELIAQLKSALALIENPEKRDRFNLAAAALINNNGYAERAIEWINQALKQKPQDKALLYARTLYKEPLGLFDEMIAELKELVKQHPDDLNIKNALGYTLVDQNQQLDLAETLVQSAYDGLPQNPAVIDSKGWLEFRKGNIAESIVYLTRAFKLSPSADIAAHLGEALWVSDKKELAIHVWQRGKAIDPTNSVLIKTLKRLNVEL
ncbi:tetratricopeptide repeat protein [Aliikangiella sp. IMCC44632]